MNESLFQKVQTEFKFSYSKSSGPGGQHVNTTDTKVTIQWCFWESQYLSSSQKHILQQKLSSYLNKNNCFFISSSKTRSRLRNQEDCLKRSFILIKKAFQKKKARLATSPTKSSIKKRLDSKKHRSERKKSRKKVDSYE